MRLRLLLVATALVASPVAAQVAGPNARAAGMGFAYGAVARGFAAGFWNPANLGQQGNPGFSLGLPNVAVDYGSDPIPFSEFKKYEGEFIDDEVKSDWLDQIGPNGSLVIHGRGDIGEIGLSVGPVALTLGTVGSMQADLPHDAVEVLLYGNAGQDGNGTDTLGFTDGQFTSWAASRAGASIGIPIGHHLSVGITGKYVAGHGIVAGRDGEARLTPDTTTIRFPVIILVDENNPVQNTGWGIDLGAAWRSEEGRLRVSFAAYDVSNTFKFDPTKGRATTGAAYISVDSSSSDFDDVDLADASDSVKAAARRIADEAIFAPSYRLAAAYKPNGRITLAADALIRTGGEFSLQGGLGNEYSLGAELRFIPLIPIRGGIHTQDDGMGFNAGAGLDFGFLKVDGAIGKRANGGYAYAVGVTMIGQ